MKSLIDKLSLNEKNITDLSRIKTITNLKHNTIISRWALVISLLNKNEPPPIDQDRVSKDIPSIEWETFAGKYGDIYYALIMQRLKKNKIEVTKENLEDELSKHVTRGLMTIAANKKIVETKNKNVQSLQVRNTFGLLNAYFEKI